MTPTQSTLLRAAELLEELASDIYACNTIDGVWEKKTEKNQVEHAELVEVAAELRGIARRKK